MFCLCCADRLADMGFDRTEAAQAYLACDKNEALAANLLMDGGFGFGGGGGDSGGSNHLRNSLSSMCRYLLTKSWKPPFPSVVAAKAIRRSGA